MALPLIRLLAPTPFAVFQTKSGNNYTADSEGRLSALLGDVNNLMNDGCVPIGDISTSDVLIGVLVGANMNVTTDQAIPLPFLPVGVKWRARRITARNASISLSTAVGGIYTAASKSGAIVAASQVYSALTASNIDVDLTFSANLTQPASLQGLFLSLTTPQGAAATADIYVYAEIVF